MAADRRLRLKRAMARLARRATHAGGRRIILLYHTVGDSPWTLSPGLFGQQLDWLAGQGALVSFEELLTGAASDSLAVALSFDDGYASLAGPVRDRLGGLSATVYMNSASISPTRLSADPSAGFYPGEAFLTRGELEELHAAGWTVGSHGVRHHDLTRLDAAALREELGASKAAIEAWLGVPCRHFAYPWGRHDPRVRRAVRDAGYETAVTGRHGPLADVGDPFALPRINIHRDYTLDDFKAIVRGDWDYLRWVQQARALFA